MHVAKWLREGWPKEIILIGVQSAMARKQDGPPYSIKFFERAIASEIARQNAPLPSVTPGALPRVQEIRENPHAEARKFDSSDWRQRSDRKHAAYAEIQAGADRIRAANGSSDPGHGTPLRLVSDARRV
jgi:hypothetical protein